MSKINIKALCFSVCLFFLSNFSCIAQTDKKVTTSINGALMISTDANGNVFYNMGGPSVKISQKKWYASVNMLPSLRFFDVNGTINVNPILGTGIMFGYKRFIVGFPCYYLATKNSWIFTAGAGVRLGK